VTYMGRIDDGDLIAPWKPLRPKPKRKAGRAAQWGVWVPCGNRPTARQLRRLIELRTADLPMNGNKPTVRRINLPDAGQGRV
jgi:hypothetical protein